MTGQLSPALVGAGVAFAVTGPSSVPSQTTPTDQTGTGYYNFTIGGAGTWTVSARYAGDSTHAGSSAICSIVVLQTTSLALNCPPTATNDIPLTGTLSPAVNGAPIAITYTSDVAGYGPYTDNATAGSQGGFADTSPAEDGGSTVTVQAAYAGDRSHAGSSSTCTVTMHSL